MLAILRIFYFVPQGSQWHVQLCRGVEFSHGGNCRKLCSVYEQDWQWHANKMHATKVPSSQQRRADTDLSEEVSVRLCLGSASSSRPSTLGVKEQKHPSSEKIVERLPQLTEVLDPFTLPFWIRKSWKQWNHSAFSLVILVFLLKSVQLRAHICPSTKDE